MRPVTAVAVAIKPTVSTSAILRPFRSPSAPMTTAPTGRMKKPTPKVAKLLNKDAKGSSLGKKLAPICVAKRP
jgi:hypothetical protein